MGGGLGAGEAGGWVHPALLSPGPEGLLPPAYSWGGALRELNPTAGQAGSRAGGKQARQVPLSPAGRLPTQQAAGGKHRPQPRPYKCPLGRLQPHSSSMAGRGMCLVTLVLLGAAVCGEWTWMRGQQEPPVWRAVRQPAPPPPTGSTRWTGKGTKSP